MSEKLSRRQFLKVLIGGLVGGGFVYAYTQNQAEQIVYYPDGTVAGVVKNGVFRSIESRGTIQVTKATAAGTPSGAPTETPTPKPTETPTRTPTPTQTEIATPKAGLEITGVPDIVNPSQMRNWANKLVAAPGDVIHRNTIQLGTEGWLAEPGVRTANDKKDCGNNPSCWELTPNRQHTLTDPHREVWPLNEEGFAMFTGATMFLNVNDRITVYIPRFENNGWIVILRGLSRDYQVGTDNNLPVEITNYDPGFATVTMLPPGQFVSEDYFKQNALAVQGTYDDRNPSGCGADGCKRVSALFLDVQTGAYAVIQRDNPQVPWKLLKTNLVIGR